MVPFVFYEGSTASAMFLGGCLMLATFSFCPSGWGETTALERSNIVGILVGDLGCGDVHSLNLDRRKKKTPWRDQVAREGLLLAIFECANDPVID